MQYIPHPITTKTLLKGALMKKIGNAKKQAQTANELATAIDIHFYRSNEKPYGVFSNLHRTPVIFEGCEFPTAEHAYQAGKARKEAVREWILSAPTPSLAAMAAHGLYTWDIVPSWSKIKFDRMRDVLRAKFTQHEGLRALLLATGDARLVEAGTTNNAVNRLWGEVNGKGQNMLGVLLMEVRNELRKGAEAQLNNPIRPRRKASAQGVVAPV
jgi:ribA/ribD-fused uncharacterized protein